MLNPLRPSISVTYDGKLSTMAKLKQLPEVNNWREELEIFIGAPIGRFNEFCDMIRHSNQSSTKEYIELLSFPDAVSTCVCLVNNAHISQLEYFADPIFQTYGSEDIDTSWRVMKLGFDCAVAKNVYIHHFRGKTLKDNNLDREGLLKKSDQTLYMKWQKEIIAFLKSQAALGVDVEKKLSEGVTNTGLLANLI